MPLVPLEAACNAASSAKSRLDAALGFLCLVSADLAAGPQRSGRPAWAATHPDLLGGPPAVRRANREIAHLDLRERRLVGPHA